MNHTPDAKIVETMAAFEILPSLVTKLVRWRARAMCRAGDAGRS